MLGVNDSTGVDGLSRKRARIEDSDTDSRSNDEPRGRIAGEAEEIRQRDHEFWYDDGTVILIARNVEFRIYKGLLSDHSSVFRDMFSLPQPPAPSNSESPPCPIVHLSDSPEDLRYVLRIYMARGEPRYVRSNDCHNLSPSSCTCYVAARLRTTIHPST